MNRFLRLLRRILPRRIFYVEVSNGPMTLDDYQELASRTWNPKNTDQDNLLNFALGLAGEAGEVIELIKKHVYHGQPLDETKLKKELGDVQWYLSGLAKVRNLKLSDVGEHNIAKLRARFPQGFSNERTVVREGDAA